MGRPTATMTRAWAAHLGIPVADLDVDVLRSSLTAGTVPGALARAAAEHPGSTLAVDRERVTLRELHELVRRCATVLASSGAGPGTRVVVCAPSSLRLVAVYLAVLHVGATAVLLNPSSTPEEVATTVRRTGAALVVADDEDLVAAMEVAASPLGVVCEKSRSAEPHLGTALDGGDVALLAFTSGTTGTPKGVPLTHSHLLSSIRGAMWSWRWSSADVLVHALPLFHQHGLSGIHATLLAGSSAAVLSRFTPETLVDAVSREGATVLFGVPSIHRRLLELPRERLVPLRHLRLVTSGSAPLPVALAEAFEDATGITLLERYGLTESGLDLSNPYDGVRAPGRVGTPLPGVEVALTDEHGVAVPADTDGEIVLRGPQVFDGYLDEAQATAAAFWPGGWFRTGDLGRWDDHGRLQITGRLKDLVITGGMNVSPREVEAVVEQLGEVHEAAVAGLPSERWGEEVAVWVVPNGSGPVDPERVIRHCREHLAAYKCPKQVFEIEQIPRNPMGKILRGRLVEETAR